MLETIFSEIEKRNPQVIDESQKQHDLFGEFYGTWEGYYIQDQKRTTFAMVTWPGPEGKLEGVVKDYSYLGFADIIAGRIDMEKKEFYFEKQYRLNEYSGYIIFYTGTWRHFGKISGSWKTSPENHGEFAMTKTNHVKRKYANA
jgi:hypothetical protein